MTVHDHVTAARERLVRAGIGPESAILDAEVLARYALGWDRATYLSNRHTVASSAFENRYAQLVARREQREPVPFITGHREFWGLDFEVTRDVLIPRPETELILEEAIALVGGQPSATPVSIVDAGTGCGCLATALAVELPGAHITATDISPAALRVARRNAARHGVADRIRWVETSFLTNLDDAPNLVVSNPPYVPAGAAAALSPEVRDYEPAIAVLSGTDGLAALRELVRQAEGCLTPGGWLIVEFGLGQEAALRALVSTQPCLSVVKIRSDLQGIARTAVIRREEHSARSAEAISGAPAES